MYKLTFKKSVKQMKLMGMLFIFGFIFACQENNHTTAPSDTPELQSDSQSPQVLIPLEVEQGSALSESALKAEGLLNIGAKAEQDLADLVREKYEPITESNALSKVSASNCKVDFNSSSSLSWMVDQCYSTFATWPYYIHGCPSYWVYTNPLNLDHFHLTPEASNQCFGTSPKWGTQSGSNCINQSDAKYWPRIATNMGSNTGVEFYAKSKSDGSSKNMTLKRLVVKSGTVRVVVYRTDIGGWWQWTGLGVGAWTWSVNNTNLSKIRIYDTNKNGTVTFDDLEVAF